MQALAEAYAVQTIRALSTGTSFAMGLDDEAESDTSQPEDVASSTSSEGPPPLEEVTDDEVANPDPSDGAANASGGASETSAPGEIPSEAPGVRVSLAQQESWYREPADGPEWTDFQTWQASHNISGGTPEDTFIEVRCGCRVDSILHTDPVDEQCSQTRYVSFVELYADQDGATMCPACWPHPRVAGENSSSRVCRCQCAACLDNALRRVIERMPLAVGGGVEDVGAPENAGGQHELPSGRLSCAKQLAWFREVQHGMGTEFERWQASYGISGWTQDSISLERRCTCHASLGRGLGPGSDGGVCCEHTEYISYRTWIRNPEYAFICEDCWPHHTRAYWQDAASYRMSHTCKCYCEPCLLMTEERGETSSSDGSEGVEHGSSTAAANRPPEADQAAGPGAVEGGESPETQLPSHADYRMDGGIPVTHSQVGRDRMPVRASGLGTSPHDLGTTREVGNTRGTDEIRSTRSKREQSYVDPPAIEFADGRTAPGFLIPSRGRP
jgi:hypothetical protein